MERSPRIGCPMPIQLGGPYQFHRFSIIATGSLVGFNATVHLAGAFFMSLIIVPSVAVGLLGEMT